jgi:aerobic-type carbon monoxide dehydrogenase small subunit (CoxS/CutS family)
VKSTLRVNGKTREIDVPRRTTLLSALRDDISLTGTRYGCGVAQCGACYVLVNGRAVASCVMTVEQVADAEITTIEGLAKDGVLSPLQQAFIDKDAMQCGYCTSGMLISATALLAADPHPSDEVIRDALAGHLCRCGVYVRAIDAVKAAAR